MAFGIDDALGIGGALLGGLFGGDSQGGTQTVSKAPWDAAAPWLKQNLQTGQDLQNYYQNNPFNQQQQQAYAQLFGQNNAMQQAIPGLLAQMQQPMGYDPSNPGARPSPIQFPQAGLLQQGGGGGMTAGGSGLLGDMNVTANPFRNGGIPAATPAPTPAPLNQNPFWGYNKDLYGAT